MRLTVNGRIFNYPDPGTEIGWGEDATAWAEEVTTTINSLDTNIPIQQFASIQPSTTANVLALSMESTSIAAIVQYIISHESNPAIYETGNLYFQNNGSWTMTRQITSTTLSGIVLSCTSLGQVQYTSPAFTGNVTIRFKNISLIEGA